jgi:membrane protein implicated in regulation of membrane protease activity
MAGWVAWLIGAGVLAAGEIAMTTFVLGPLALAAGVAGVVGLAGVGVELQVVAFAAGAAASLGIARPIARRHLRMPAAIRTGTAALVGESAVVLERVDADTGRVRLGGEVWSARSYNEEDVIEPGTRVVVFEIKGATALVGH